MANSSPLRRSQLLSSPDRPYLSNFLLDSRNNELSHRDALAAAQAEHDRVREAAIRVYELHELKEEHNRILEQERREQERLKAEAAIAAEEKRLQELKAKSIPKPPAPPPEPAKPVEKPAGEKKPVSLVPEPQEAKGSEPLAKTQAQTQPSAPAPQQNGLFSNSDKPIPSSPFAAAGQQSKTQQASVLSQNKTSQPDTKTSQPQHPVAPSQTPQLPKSPVDPLSDRYIRIHQALKQLRKNIVAVSKVAGSPLKGKVGAIRREIRMSIGQLSDGKGANVESTTKIMSFLRQSLDGQLPSPPVDVGQFVAVPREPSTQDIPNNGAELPSLFIYLMNICAKAIIVQFIKECEANPKAADPIGVFAAQVFSHKDFSWRGQSLIDILVAKFRVVCPVLFGSRGNDKTEKGKQALGWKKDGPSWIPEQTHNERMAGLGAGFASISLRDFSKASKTNPYPPTHYWKAFASIVNCPSAEISNTQLVVLRSMIAGHESRFINFYGNAAIAALQLALVEFPKRAPANSSAAGPLRALAEILRSDSGLAFA
ncbi:RNA export mediator Gle1 [Metarhizium acridum CQMa 102]|uniref:mRNA export factor GLE1 n=1 Tax=Metarhizium acridum (strain CQMa 102) TaxID=655827 RepID=E9E7V7_METAQ|nr:RNA export mediator Gle1 [Metarhizium acridum CQMa 102]EFY87964.1 RNA export mediator Gle1 [Metarhizium acridum CQMa 102]